MKTIGLIGGMSWEISSLQCKFSRNRGMSGKRGME